MAPSQLTDVAVPAERAVEYAQEAGSLTLGSLPGRDLDPEDLVMKEPRDKKPKRPRNRRHGRSR